MSIDTDKLSVLTNQEDFLSRWSRRKHETRQQQELAETASESSPEKVDITTLPTDADMPPVESLTEDSDYSGFLSPKVSEALRKQALQKLFHSTGFNVCDGLDDYDEDFTQFAKLGDIITADMKHQLDMEAQRNQHLAENESSAKTDSEQMTPEEITPEGITQDQIVPKQIQIEASDAPQQVSDESYARNIIDDEEVERT